MGMDSDEAREIAKAYADVAQYYPKMKLPGHVSAVVTLGTLVTVNYGARIVAYRMRKANERFQASQAPRTQAAPQGVSLRTTPPMNSMGGQPVTPIKPVAIDPSAQNSASVATPPDANIPKPSPDGWTAPENAPLQRRIITDEVRTGEIPGVGKIVFPSDHPLLGGSPFTKN